MKKTLIVYLAAIVTLAACGNDNSSTYGTYEKSEKMSAGDEQYYHGVKGEKTDVKESHENTEPAAGADTAVINGTVKPMHE